MTTQSSSIQYAYALDGEGTLTHIGAALRSHTYTCPGCKSPLTPVMGEFNAKHFRHSEECCALKNLSSQVRQRSILLSLPTSSQP